MRVLIIGGTGMLGHQLWQHFRTYAETWVTLRRPPETLGANAPLFAGGRTLVLPDATDTNVLRRIVTEVRPDVVLNCIGIVKQLKEAKAAIPSIAINALMPHQLAEICGTIGARLILFSTDCVFSGRRGAYTENDFADADDLYGRTKYLGEVSTLAHVFTIRSSIIGRELTTAHSLVDWFLSQSGGRVSGYRRAIYTGFTTIEMGRIVQIIIERHLSLAGVWHVASEPISKYELLRLLKSKFKLDVEIAPTDEFVCDRSLDGRRFAAATGYVAPSWDNMAAELAQDSATGATKV